MAIETIGSFERILQGHDANSWAKKARVELKNEFDYGTTDFKTQGVEMQKSFSEILSESITDVNKLQGEANTAIENLVTGRSKNLHETMLAVEKAEIAYKAMNQIRLKVLDAYKEVMRMQI